MGATSTGSRRPPAAATDGAVRAAGGRMRRAIAPMRAMRAASHAQECRLVSMHGLLRLLRLLIRAQLIR
jgi:hypothetical protein